MRAYFKLFLRVFSIDLLLFSLLAFIGYFSKKWVANFFVRVQDFQTQAQALQSGLANKSSEALFQFEPLLQQMESMARFVYYYTLYLLPLIVILLFSIAVYVQFSRKFSWKMLGRIFIFDIPFLVFFYFIESPFFDSVAVLGKDFFMYSILLLLAFYVWHTGILLLLKEEQKKYRVLYAQFLPLFLRFVLFIIFFALSLILAGYFVLKIYTASFLGLEWISVLLLIFLSLLLAEFFRLWYARKLDTLL
ncbi:hypothetical protein HZA98_01030 [Candidatus Woesearchaeota archaeon]|nr:hypothetical protein [Candidatus Woesearchaeota archaeon]